MVLALVGAVWGGFSPAQGEGPVYEALIAKADAALARRDGIDAEMKLREAMAQGAPSIDTNALMGQAMMIQGRLDRARPWLEGGQFSEKTAAAGWRSLGLLERLEDNLPASGRAYDQALRYIPDDASLWVEIGRLRYVGGEHLLAIQASIHALELDDKHVRALEFRGQLVRDRYGLKAALPWFEQALQQDPDDVTVLLEYAATLGEMGQASACLSVTRKVLEIDPDNARAYYLQAVLAGRAGDYALAKSLLARTKTKLDHLPGVQLLRGVVEIVAGNPRTATEALEAVIAQQPDNRHAYDLLARAIMLQGRYEYMTLRFAAPIERGDASPYTLTMVARAFEMLDDRQQAGELLDRAAQPPLGQLRILGQSGRIGELLKAGGPALQQAEQEVDVMRREQPGFYDAQSLSGDVQLALGRPVEAQKHYDIAAEIRMSDSLFMRRYAAYMQAGDRGGAKALVHNYLEQNPQSHTAMRAAAELSVQTGDSKQAHAQLTWLRDHGESGNLAVLSQLALVEAGMGDVKAARQNAQSAYRLQRSSPVAAQTLGYTYALSGVLSESAYSLLAKARNTLGDTPLIRQAMGLLAQNKRRP